MATTPRPPSRLARISHHESAPTAQPPCLPAGRAHLLAGSSSESRFYRRPQCGRSPKGFGSYRGPARIYARLHGLATIPGEKCGLAAWLFHRSEDAPALRAVLQGEEAVG